VRKDDTPNCSFPPMNGRLATAGPYLPRNLLMEYPAAAANPLTKRTNDDGSGTGVIGGETGGCSL